MHTAQPIITMDTPANMNLPEEDIKKRQQDIDDDYELTRNTYRTLLKKNAEAVEKLYNVCEESEHPRAFEVFSKLTKDTADIADKLLEMQRKKQIVDTESAMDMIKAREESGLPMITATIVSEKKFIGTAEDMQKRIAMKRQQTNIVDARE